MTLLDKIQANRELWEDKTPCFVVDRDAIIDKLEKFSTLFDGELAYSLKTNPHLEIARLIHQRGYNFTVCSTEELQDLQKIIVDISGIIYLSPALDEEELNEVSLMGVRRLSLDSPAQVELAVSHAHNLDEVFLRVATGYKVQQENFPYEKNSFLGIPIEDALPYLEALSQIGIRIGIHNHLSSQNADLESWRENLDILNEFVKSAKQKALSLNSVNLGGGFPISYNSHVPPLEGIAQVVSEHQRKIKASYPNISFVFEPGRYVAGESIALVTRVKQKKKFRDRNVLIVDTSTYNSSMDTMLVGLDLPCQAILDNDKTEETYTIRGRSPCSLDIFCKDVILPKTETGDYLVFLNAGAYNFASDFVSMKKPQTILI